MIESLIEQGNAYVADNGDVYFSVRSRTQQLRRPLRPATLTRCAPAGALLGSTTGSATFGFALWV